MALIADSHLGATLNGEEFGEQIKRIEEQEPDILLIAGDFVDDDSSKVDMVAACKALGEMKTRYGVWFAYGNHDEGYFDGRDFTADELAQELNKNGVHTLADKAETAGDLCIVGRKDQRMGSREELADLLKGVDRSKYIVVLDHEPTDYENESGTDADLVLSGHTHGGQLFPMGQIAVALGINDRAYGYEKRDSTEFLVTSGISDWAIDFKTGTKSEYVLIDLEGKK
jgi:predicted MPP superfamily phosphohydrolase